MKRKCNVCGDEKPLTKDYFYRDKRRKHGFRYTCKCCEKARQKKYRQNNKEFVSNLRRCWYDRNKEHVRLYNKSYRTENKNWYAEYRRNYREKNKSEIKKYNDKWRMINKDKVSDQGKRYYERNKEKFRHRHHKRAANRRDSIANFTVGDWERCKVHFNNSCAYCGEKAALEQDHFIPLSKGGGYTRENIIPACRSCNASKYNNAFGEWYPKHSGYSKERESKIVDYLKGQKTLA